MDALALVAGLVIVAALDLYAISGGADYGGGVWDLLARGPRAGRQRDLISHAIGPIWEANHVWLILAIVVLFTGFPAAFARITTILHVPFFLMLLGIVARGAAFSFRSYGSPQGETQGRWGRVFAVASLITPLLLGTILGAVAAGTVPAEATSAAVFFTSWLGLFPLSVGLYALIMFAFLAAVYLTVEAEDEELREDFRRRALASGILLGILAAAVLAVAGLRVPEILEDLTRTPWSWALHAFTAAAALGTLFALWRRLYPLARIGAVLQVSLIIWGWAFSQYPHLIEPDLTLWDAAAPHITLKLLLEALALGAVLLVPSFVYLFRVFGKVWRAVPTSGGPRGDG
ncbi:MAG TPA: cytochrome d ubiquinol oxidase subunit II [Thermoanaerobaculia bacterium]|nr:cytochrome d ubiquinol oxidase subunit II [Thermoanaerobaculia bacterium]